MNQTWDLVDLQVFCLAARRGSFVGAATELGISPAYVTKRIASLESSLRVGDALERARSQQSSARASAAQQKKGVYTRQRQCSVEREE